MIIYANKTSNLDKFSVTIPKANSIELRKCFSDDYERLIDSIKIVDNRLVIIAPSVVI